MRPHRESLSIVVPLRSLLSRRRRRRCRPVAAHQLRERDYREALPDAGAGPLRSHALPLSGGGDASETHRPSSGGTPWR